MKPGAVIVDVAIDQGGCIETTHETTHDDPVYEVHGVLHYAVGNMPGAVPHTSTYALTNATLPYVLEVAVDGPLAAIDDPALAHGVNTARGQVTNAAGRRIAFVAVRRTAHRAHRGGPPMKLGYSTGYWGRVRRQARSRRSRRPSASGSTRCGPRRPTARTRSPRSRGGARTRRRSSSAPASCRCRPARRRPRRWPR